MLESRRKKRTGSIKRIRSQFGKNVEHEVLVFVSSRNLYVQVVNLGSGNTVFTLSTCNKSDKKNHRNIKIATELGKRLSEECKKRGINVNDVPFNRAEKIFHGVVKAIADGFKN